MAKRANKDPSTPPGKRRQTSTTSPVRSAISLSDILDQRPVADDTIDVDANGEEEESENDEEPAAEEEAEEVPIVEQNTDALQAYECIKPIGEVDPVVQGINNRIFAKVIKAKNDITTKVGRLDHTEIVDIGEEGGVRKAYSKADCQYALKTRGKYSSGNTIFAANHFSAPARCAHHSELKLNWLVDRFFTRVFDEVPYALHAALPPVDCAEKFLGNLMITSPPEMYWAPLLGLQQLIAAGISDADIDICKKALQNVELHMTIFFTSEQVLFACHQRRKDFEQIGLSVKQTCMQKVFHVLQARTLIGENATGNG